MTEIFRCTDTKENFSSIDILALNFLQKKKKKKLAPNFKGLYRQQVSVDMGFRSQIYAKQKRLQFKRSSKGMLSAV